MLFCNGDLTIRCGTILNLGFIIASGNLIIEADSIGELNEYLEIPDLPNKIYARIISPLNIKDILHMRLSCHKWNVAINELPSSICKTIIPSAASDRPQDDNSLPLCDGNLPNELLIKIFANLPVSDLCRTMLVCKSWNVLAGAVIRFPFNHAIKENESVFEVVD